MLAETMAKPWVSRVIPSLDIPVIVIVKTAADIPAFQGYKTERAPGSVLGYGSLAIFILSS
jgi:hypothetical protein